MHTTTAPDRRTAEHSSLTATERSQRARLAARARWANDDGSKGTQAARDTFLSRFEREVDPEGRLAPDERAKRADSARRAYFQRLAWQRHEGARAARRSLDDACRALQDALNAR